MRPRPVDLSVSRLRDALWQACRVRGAAGDGPGALTGSIFHDAMAGLLAGPNSWRAVLTNENLGDYTALRRHSYETVSYTHLTLPTNREV